MQGLYRVVLQMFCPKKSVFQLCLLTFIIALSYGQSSRLNRRRHQTGCGEHGTLIDHHCHCNHGYTGTHCAQLDCQNGGTTGSTHCHCPSKYYGKLCEHVKPICQHGGVFEAHYGRCHCTSHYTGDLCEIVSPSVLCNSNTCIHGHCFHDNTQYFCKCTTGFTGRHCEHRLITQPPPTTPRDLCMHVTCHHGGHCFHDNRQFYCRCVDGYIGRYCETKIVTHTACSSTPCKHGGHCYEDNSQFFCNCLDGYTGKTCETKIVTHTACSSTPCKHGGHCYEDNSQFFCNCLDGYTGKTCENCTDVPCTHGMCISTNSTYYCNCYPGYTGKTCAYALISCTANLCQNGGHCYHDDLSYVCICKPGFSGSHCEVDLSAITTTQAVTPPLTVSTLKTNGPNETTLTTPGYPRCNHADVVLGLIHNRVDHPYARKCPTNDDSVKQADAIVMKFCGAQNVTSWRQGAKVTSNCKNLPTYVPIAEWHDDKVTSKSGVFLSCGNDGSFQFFTQTCNDNYNLTTMLWPESEFFYVIEN